MYHTIGLIIKEIFINFQAIFWKDYDRFLSIFFYLKIMIEINFFKVMLKIYVNILSVGQASKGRNVKTWKPNFLSY